MSRNFRAPTFNDRYWLDAGKTDLLPETSFAGEGGVRLENTGGTTIGITAFYQHVDEWIQWVPGTNDIFRPQNIKSVVAKGLEARANTRTSLGQMALFANVAYQFTSSVTVSSHDINAITIGKQLIYTPRHTAAGTIGSKLKTWCALFNIQYSGERFTEASNALHIDSIPLPLDFSITKSWDNASAGKRSDSKRQLRNRLMGALW